MGSTDTLLASVKQALEDEDFQPSFGVWRNGFLVGDAASYRLGLYDWTGKLARVISRNVDRSALTSAQAEAAFTSWQESPPGRRATPSALEAKRAELLESRHPHFTTFLPAAIDGSGRFWIFGPAGDSVYADAFADTEFLGRATVACPGFRGRSEAWSVAGSWVAMACAPTDTAYVGNAVLKLFKIVEQ